MFVIDAGINFGNVQNFVPIRAEAAHNLAVDAFVRNEPHPTAFSIG